MRVLVINGPNLDLLGTREPETYGFVTLDELEQRIAGWGESRDIEVDFHQTNDEGELISTIHGGGRFDGVIVNPAAFTHTSRAIADAVASVPAPVVEVHISNVKSREPWRATSVLEEVVTRTIFGRGIEGYRDALTLIKNLQLSPTTIRYGPHRENVADLRVPPEVRALVVLLHGGLWLQQSGRDTVDSLATGLFSVGYASLNVEYRRSGMGGSWPGSAHDVKMALDFLPQIQGIDGLPLALIGHSAGGYLSLWLGARRGPHPTVCLAPITDLAELAAGDLPSRLVAAEMLASGAPARVSVEGDVLAIHGSDDRLVPVNQSRRLQAARVETHDGLGHLELLDPVSRHWDQILDFLENTVG